MIGPFALVCLDMAGTTVRDDGAVDAAFTTALATIGIGAGSPGFAEAQEMVHDTMGWSKADVFAELLDPDEAGRATAAFAAAYEEIVEAGEVGEVPGALVMIRACGRGACGCASRPGSRRRRGTRCSTCWVGGTRSTSPSRRPMSAGAGRRPT